VTAGTGLTAATAVLSGEPTQVLPVTAGAPPNRSRTPLVVGVLLVLGLAGGALAYKITQSSSAPGDTGTLAPITLPTKTTGTTAAATTTAPSTTVTTEQATSQPLTTQQQTAPPPTTQPTTAPATTAPPPTTTAPPTTDTTATTSTTP
jgi:hypothetical protein